MTKTKTVKVFGLFLAPSRPQGWGPGGRPRGSVERPGGVRQWPGNPLHGFPGCVRPAGVQEVEHEKQQLRSRGPAGCNRLTRGNPQEARLSRLVWTAPTRRHPTGAADGSGLQRWRGRAQLALHRGGRAGGSRVGGGRVRLPLPPGCHPQRRDARPLGASIRSLDSVPEGGGQGLGWQLWGAEDGDLRAAFRRALAQLQSHYLLR